MRRIRALLAPPRYRLREPTLVPTDGLAMLQRREFADVCFVLDSAAPASASSPAPASASSPCAPQGLSASMLQCSSPCAPQGKAVGTQPQQPQREAAGAQAASTRSLDTKECAIDPGALDSGALDPEEAALTRSACVVAEGGKVRVYAHRVVLATR